MRPRIGRIAGDRGPQDRDLLEPAGERRARPEKPRPRRAFAAAFASPAALMQPPEVIQGELVRGRIRSDRRGGLDRRDRVLPQPGCGQVQPDVQMRLQVTENRVRHRNPERTACPRPFEAPTGRGGRAPASPPQLSRASSGWPTCRNAAAGACRAPSGRRRSPAAPGGYAPGRRPRPRAASSSASAW